MEFPHLNVQDLHQSHGRLNRRGRSEATEKTGFKPNRGILELLGRRAPKRPTAAEPKIGIAPHIWP